LGELTDLEQSLKAIKAMRSDMFTRLVKEYFPELKIKDDTKERLNYVDTL
jgi:hypothetical protein